MSDYKAIVVKVNTRPHPNADRLQLGLCLGNQVIVGLDTQDGQLGVFFNTDGQLSQEFCEANDLIRRKDPKTGKPAGGMFDANRRVRAQKFRREKSDGFWVPMSYFEFTGYDTGKLQEGMQFDELNGVPICCKYYTKATKRQMGKTVKNNRRETPMFPMHFQTDQFRYYVNSIRYGALITITEKLHGSSGRLGHVLDDVPKKFAAFRRLWNRIPIIPKLSLYDKKWVYLNGSRRVILERSDSPGFYGNDQFRYEVIDKLINNLHKGEIIFFEIVGWVNEDTPIMPPHDTTKTQDQEFTAHYGERMWYNYGCPQGTRELYVYRIAHVTTDGKLIDLPWNAVKARCRELRVEHVPEIVGQFLYNSTPEFLSGLIEDYCQGPSLVDEAHGREGACVRVDAPTGETYIYKHKNFNFRVMEDIAKVDENYIDLEEVS